MTPIRRREKKPGPEWLDEDRPPGTRAWDKMEAGWNGIRTGEGRVWEPGYAGEQKRWGLQQDTTLPRFTEY